MAWSIVILDIENILQIKFDPAPTTTPQLNEDDLTKSLEKATARVNALLESNGYIVADIQADNTTDAFKWLDNLVLSAAVWYMICWQRLSNASGDKNNKVYGDKVEADLKALEFTPRKVLAGIIHPDTAPNMKPGEVLVSKPDPAPRRIFKHNEILY